MVGSVACDARSLPAQQSDLEKHRPAAPTGEHISCLRCEMRVSIGTSSAVTDYNMCMGASAHVRIND